MNSAKPLTLSNKCSDNINFGWKMSNLQLLRISSTVHIHVQYIRPCLDSLGTSKSNASMLDEICVVNCFAGLIGKLHLGKQVQVRPIELSEAYNAYYFDKN